MNYRKFNLVSIIIASLTAAFHSHHFFLLLQHSMKKHFVFFLFLEMLIDRDIQIFIVNLNINISIQIDFISQRLYITTLTVSSSTIKIFRVSTNRISSFCQISISTYIVNNNLESRLYRAASQNQTRVRSSSLLNGK